MTKLSKHTQFHTYKKKKKKKNPITYLFSAATPLKPHKNPINLKSTSQSLQACLVRVFVFYFGFMIFYFIEVGTLILI